MRKPAEAKLKNFTAELALQGKYRPPGWDATCLGERDEIWGGAATREAARSRGVAGGGGEHFRTRLLRELARGVARVLTANRSPKVLAVLSVKWISKLAQKQINGWQK